MKKWYVVNTKSHEETTALVNLRRQGFNAYLPQYKKTRRHARRTDTILAPLFPKYLFVEFCLDLENWHCINSTIGVKKLIQFGAKPTPVPSELVSEIIERENADGVVALSEFFKFKRGDKITVIDGVFTDVTGIFECRNDNNRVQILLDIMGRNVRVCLSPTAISA